MAFGEIDIPFWQEAGFRLSKCEVTGARFRTRDPQRKTCGDTHLDPYTFIGAPIISGYEERGSALKEKMREAFLNFFEKKGHARLEPYPVVARWRDDIHLTIASIADFQPHVTSGRTPPPANPLTISQPCIRLTDVAAVGRSGRHLTTFEMMAHHAFNRESTGEYHYWIDNCVRLCDELLVETFGIEPKEITYVENPWSGGGNAGAALEVIVGGLELATLVFMDLEEHNDGEIEIKGLRYRQMDQRIIDTGYGLERFCWAAAGTPTIYETVYPESVKNLRDLSKFNVIVDSLDIPVDIDTLLGELSRLAGILNIDVGTDAEELYSSLADRISQDGAPISVSQLKSITEPLALIYAIPDHLQALCSMLGDGLVPSNSKAGYLARMLARRVCRMKEDLGIDIKLADLGNQHLDLNMANRKDIDRGVVIDILNSEERKYSAMLDRGRSAVSTALKDIPFDSRIVDDEIIYRLAEERGIQPEMTLTIAHDLGWKDLEIRVGFAADMAARNAQRTKEAALKPGSSSLNSSYPSTIRLFDDNPGMVDFDAQVIDCIETESVDGEGVTGNSWILILDRSAFYPESGGQIGDRGIVGSAKVFDVRIENGVILHYVDRMVGPGRITGSIDENRRIQISQHHSSVHVVGGSARHLLGPHVWQAGSFKDDSFARLDLTHYSRLSRTQLDQIEDHANEIVSQNRNIEITVLPRMEADSSHGFSIYQGGPPKHDNIRLVSIDGHDLQACGGTHVAKTSEIGEIRIVRSSQVQDGVERLVVMAGEAAREHARQQSELLSESAQILGVQPNDLPQAVERFFKEWKDQRKTIEQLRADIARIRAGGDTSATVKNGIRYVIMEMDGEVKELMATLGELTRDPSKPTVAVIASKQGGGKLVVAITEDSVASEMHDASEIIRVISPAISGSGGGRPTMAQAGGTNPGGIDNALNLARRELGI